MKQRALLIGLAFASLVAQADEPMKEVVIGDARIGPAFYEIAPENLAASMQAAVERVCAARLEGRASILDDVKGEGVAAWLCSGDPIHFLRGVSRGGERTNDGFVCAGAAEWKYYPSGIYDESGQCIAVWYVSKKERHSVGVPD